MKGYEKENDAIKGELDNLKATIREPGAGSFEEALMKNVSQNVLNQVNNAVARYKDLVDEGKLTVVGAIYDFVDALGKGHGRVVIIERERRCRCRDDQGSAAARRLGSEQESFCVEEPPTDPSRRYNNTWPPRLRHRYHDATVRWGRQGSARSVSSCRLGRSPMP